jgi:hypothetical protein
MNQSGTDSRNLIRADRRTDTTAADRNTTFHFPGSDRVGEGYNEVRVIVARIHAVRPEIDNLVAHFLKMSNQFLFQSKSTVISGNTNAHVKLLLVIQLSAYATAARWAAARFFRIRKRSLSFNSELTNCHASCV